MPTGPLSSEPTDPNRRTGPWRRQPLSPGDSEATLVIACAYYPADPKDTAHAADVLGADAYQVTGSAPSNEILRTAREKAVVAGAKNVVERAVVGALSSRCSPSSTNSMPT